MTDRYAGLRAALERVEKFHHPDVIASWFHQAPAVRALLSRYDSSQPETGKTVLVENQDVAGQPAASAEPHRCEDCPPVGYPTDKTRCAPCDRRTTAPVTQEPVAWFTEDHLTDKSATTWDATVAERWRAKGWPVDPLYTVPVAQEPPKRPYGTETMSEYGIIPECDDAPVAAQAQPSVPDVLFDGYAVLSALDDKARSRTSPENVSDVLDAVVRLVRATPPADGQTQPPSTQDLEDAERYRWLRDLNGVNGSGVEIFINDEAHGPGHLTAQIDAARAAKEE